MSEVQEIINIENVEPIPVKVKRSYVSSKFSGLSEEEIKAHKKVLKAQNNKNYKENIWTKFGRHRRDISPKIQQRRR